METRLLPSLFLAALLIAAQGVLALHALEHDVDIHVGDAPEPVLHVFTPAVSRGFESVHTATARQRGPPVSS